MLIERKNKKCSLGKFFKKLFFWLLFLAFLGVSGWTMFFSNYTELKKVEIITDKLDKQPLRDISDNYRGEFWFKYWSKNNFFSFPRKTLAQTLKEQFKTIRKVNFENKFPDTLIIKIEERKRIVIWCSREQCFLIDETGSAFYQLQEGEIENRFKDYSVVIDKSNLEIQEGQKIEEGKLADFVLEIKELLKNEINLDIRRESETPSLIAEEIRVKTIGGWQIYFNLENDVNTQVELLKELFKTSFSQEEKEKLNYIDLRISGKAIYNLSDEKEEIEKIKQDSDKAETSLEKDC